MKNIFSKTLISCIVSLMCVSGAYANWQCTATNAKNQTWIGIGVTRAAAAATVMRICTKNSAYARNCQIASCVVTGPTAPAGGWQCKASNARGQIWIGIGPTRAAAAATTMGFCTRNSAYARNCQILGCYPRY